MCGRPHDLLAEAALVLAQRLLPLGGAAGAAEPPLPVLLPVVVGAVVRQLGLGPAEQPAFGTPVNICALSHLSSKTLRQISTKVKWSHFPFPNGVLNRSQVGIPNLLCLGQK